MRKPTGKQPGKTPARKPAPQSGQQKGLLLTYQATARALGITKKEVASMVSDGLLKEVRVGDTPRITARSITHALGYDPFGYTTIQLPGNEKYTKLTFEQYAVVQLNRGVRKAKSRSIDNYRCGLSMTASEIGGLPMVEIGEDDLRRAFKKLAGKYSKASLHLAYQATRYIFQHAYDAGEIPEDPTRKWDMPKSTKPKVDRGERIYSDEKIDEILRTSKEFDQELYTMLAVLECTGMRPGEMLALEWDSFDEEAKTIRIYQTVTREYGQIKELRKSASSASILSVPKSEYSVRTLSLSDTAVEALCAWRKTLRAKKRSPRGHSAFIFPGQRGRFRSLSSAEKLLQKYRKACQIENVTFYKFRHTMCTRLVLAGQPLSIIQRIMGDNSMDVVTRVYTHVGADEALRAMEGYHAARQQGSRPS